MAGFQDFLIKFFTPFLEESSPADAYLQGAKPPSIQKLEALLKTHRLSDLIPLDAFNKEHDLFINADSYGFAIELSPLIGLDEQTIQLLSTLFTGDSVQKDMVIQHTLYASPDVMPRLRRWANQFMADDQEESRNENIFRVMVRKRIEYLMQGNWDSLSEDSSLMSRDFRTFFTVQLPLPSGHINKLTDAHKQKMVSLRKSVLSVFKNNNIAYQIMKPADLIDLYDTIFNVTDIKREPRTYDDNELIRDQIINKDTLLLVGRDDLYLNTPHKDVNLSIFGVNQFPEYWAGWNNGELIGSLFEESRKISCPFLMTLTINYPDLMSQKTQANMKLQRAIQMSEAPIAKSVTSWHDKRREWQFVSNKIEEGHTNVQVNFQIVLFTEKHNTETCEKEVDSIFRANHWKLFKQRMILLPSLMMALPMGASRTYVNFGLAKKMFKTMPSWSTVNIAPWIGEYKGNENPLQLLMGYRGQISNFNPWDNKDGNFNIACAARPGSGKSFMLQDFLFSVLGQGGRAWVIDRGRSFEPLCRLLGEFIPTLFLAFDGSEKISLNPFTNVHNWDNTQDEGSERIMIHNLLIQMATRDGEALPAERSTWIDIALQETWLAKGNEAEITDVYECLKREEDQRKHDLADAIYPFTRYGVYGQYFTGPSTIDLSSDFVVLELKELDAQPQLQMIVLLILMMRIEQTMYSAKRSNRKQVCLIDEAWKLLSYGNAATFIEEGYRTARKYGGAFVTITQGINDYYSSPTTLACMDNSDWLFLLAQKESSIKQLAKMDRIPSGDAAIKLITYLRTIKGQYSSCAVIGPNGIDVERLVVDTFSELTYSTNNNDIVERQQLTEQGHSLIEALLMMEASRLNKEKAA